MSENKKRDLSEEESEIIDFQSEDRFGSTLQANARPVPVGIKWLFGGVVVALLIGVGSLYAFNSKSRSLANDTDLMPIEGDSDESVGSNELIAKLEKSRVTDQESEKAALTIGAVTEQEKMNERLVSMELQIQQMTQQIKGMAEQRNIVQQLNTQVGQIAANLKTLPTQEDLTEIRQDFDGKLQKTQDELKIRLAKIDKKAKSYVRKKRVQLPFKLVGIDQWNGVHYAAIQSQAIGAIENLRSGDTRSGWSVERIDSSESSVVFKHVKTAQSIKQSAI